MEKQSIFKTKEVIASMLTENTGTHFLDSGMENNRHWQKNQLRDFDNEPEVVVTFYAGKEGDGEILVTKNVYYFLNDCLEFLPELDSLFHGDFIKEIDPENDLCWLELMKRFPEWLKTRETHEDCRIGGLYGNGKGKPFTVNTYNGDDLLSQVLQYVYFEIDDEPIIILQIHNGCDVRGGYTKPRIFTGNEDYTIFDSCRALIQCNKQIDQPHYWETDNGYHWYFEGTCGLNAGQELQNYEFKEIENKEDIEIGKLCFIEDPGKGFCPICGSKLEVYSY